jgi:hypothetical protein
MSLAAAGFNPLHRNGNPVRPVIKRNVQTLWRKSVLGTILLIILIILLIGALPTWPYSTGWGYYPSGGFGLLLIIIIVLLVAGRI